MSVSLFPSIQPMAATSAKSETSELYKEVKWDYTSNTPVFQNGVPVIVTGKEAVLAWAWKALNTPRFRYDIYTWDYGSEAESLIGGTYTDDVKSLEAGRCVKECLLINPYISDVTDISVTISDGALSIGCKVKTIYGEGDISV